METGEPESPLRQTLLELVRQGKIAWDGGKPKGLRGVVVHGEPMAETVLKDRR